MKRFLPALLAVVCADAPGMAIDWKPASGHRVAELSVPGGGRPGFTLIDPAASGLSFSNVLPEERGLTNQILLNGSGVAAGDFDGDGWCDLFLGGLSGGSRLYRNLGGWKFEDATAVSGAAMPGLDVTGAAIADFDGNGAPDLLVSSLGAGTRLLLNDGRGRFAPPAGFTPLNVGRAGMSFAVADVDGDGDLDFYAVNYRAVTIRDQPNTRFNLRDEGGSPRVVGINGRPLTAPDYTNRFRFTVRDRDGRRSFAYDENGEEDALFLNDGRGRFTQADWTGGVFLDEAGVPLKEPPYDWGLSAMFRDLNGDGAPDLYVCNDFKSPDRIWMNDGRGRFRPLAPLALRQTPLSSMGVDFADLNRDGFDDFLVVDMLSRDHVRRFSQRIDINPESSPIGAIQNRPQYPRNALFLGRGDGTWAEIAQFSGLDATEWSWTPAFVDVDLDGYEDLLVVNGFGRDTMNVDLVLRIEAIKKTRAMSSEELLDLRRLYPKLETPNLAFRNLGNLRFADVSAEWGFNLRGVSLGLCLADLDNDGDQDVVLNNLNAPAALYRNDGSAPRVAVRLKGKAPNTRGIGARVTVRGGAQFGQSQEMICGGRYLSSDDPLRVFAAGSPSNLLTIEVTWRSGRRSVVNGVRPNTLFEIDEAFAVPNAVPAPSPKNAPLFADVSARLGHVHHEEAFDDFALQPTLPRRLSQLGPGVAWFDADGDGYDDLFIGTGKGGRLAMFHNDRGRGFSPSSPPALNQPVARDLTTVLGWRRQDGLPVVLAGESNFEDGQATGGVARLFRLSTNAVDDIGPAPEASFGPMALADVDGDGQLDLFAGGRIRTGRYPEEVSSFLLRGEGRGFVLDRKGSEALAGVGLVSAAMFSDIDADGDPDLVLACEWSSLKIFRNERGQLLPLDPPVNLPGRATVRLSQLPGWWNGVTAGDFDGDGNLDLAASNWGQNTSVEAFRSEPLRLFYGALFEDGAMQAIEARTEPGSRRLLPLQPFHVMAAAMPALRERLGSYEAYARADLPAIYGDAWKRAKELSATTLESMIFLNRGDRFEARPPPLEAQLAPAFAVVAADFDGDGREDLFLSQNFFGMPPEVSRSDAGRGLLLRGRGDGTFAAASGQDSGLLIYGEQRGAATADFDRDGRLDLVVTQNGAETRLFRNAAARPGLRVRLEGPPGNRPGFGAVLRLSSGGKPGPAREIHGGSGYWSQDSATTVLALPDGPAQLLVRWPGGVMTTNVIAADLREIAINSKGEILSK